MYGKIPCKKLKYSSQKVKYRSTVVIHLGQSLRSTTVPERSAVGAVMRFAPVIGEGVKQVNSCRLLLWSARPAGSGRYHSTTAVAIQYIYYKTTRVRMRVRVRVLMYIRTYIIIKRGRGV